MDMDVFRVDCDRCGRFEIEHAVLDQFRLAYEAADEELVSVLPRLSGYIRSAGGMPSLGVDTWQAIADAAR